MCDVTKLKNKNNYSISLSSIPNNNYFFFYPNKIRIPQIKEDLSKIMILLFFIVFIYILLY